MAITKDLTFPELCKLDTPSVSLLNYGEKSTDKGVAVFQKLVLKIVQFYGGNWTEQQILDCGKVCFDEWNYLTFAELAHFSQKAKSGAYKQDDKPLMYGSFTPAVLIDWFCTYAADNLKERAAYFANKRPAFVEPQNPVPQEQVQLALSNFAARMFDENKDERIERDELYKKIDEGVKNFNELMKLNKTIKEFQPDTTQQVPDKTENDIPTE